MMYQRVLIPLDGSELAEVALYHAKGIASRLGLEVILLHVAAKADAGSLPLHQAYMDQVSQRFRGELMALQKTTGAQLAVVKAEVAVGYPAEEILRYAAEKEADLIMMTTHGRSGVSRWVLGSVADKVLRLAELPVLLIRAGMPSDTAYEGWISPRILVPLDGSELAELVLPHVETLALGGGDGGADVVLVGICEPLVLPPATTPETSVNWGVAADDYMAKSKRSAEKYLSKLQKGLAGEGLKVRFEVLEGDPPTEIVDYSSKNRVNLIVMATHGRSGIGRWAFGSVAQKVLHGGSTPILLVRPPASPSIIPKIVAAIRSMPPM